MSEGQQLVVNMWNDLYPVGTEVVFWPGVRSGEGRPAVTTSPAWLLGGHTPVVTCGAYPGGIALTHVEPQTYRSGTQADYVLDGSPESVAIVREARGLAPLNRPGTEETRR